MKYGFGNGDETLREARANPDRSMWWEVEETLSSDGRPLFNVKRFTPLVTDREIPTMEFLIDPAKGFMITRFVAHVPDGLVGLERTVRVEQVGAESVWFPVEVEETVYESWILKGGPNAALHGEPLVTDDGRRVARTKIYRVTSIEVNGQIPDEAFTPRKALGLNDGDFIIHVYADGKKERYVYIDGVPLPQKAL